MRLARYRMPLVCLALAGLVQGQTLAVALANGSRPFGSPSAPVAAPSDDRPLRARRAAGRAQLVVPRWLPPRWLDIRLPGCDGPLVPFPSGLKLLFVADAGLREVEKLLARMRALAFQAADGTLSVGDRAILDVEFQARLEGIDRVTFLSLFQGIPLLDGSQDVCLERRSPSRAPIRVDLPDATVVGLDLLHANVVTVTNASATLARIDLAIDTVAEYRDDLARAQRELGSWRVRR